MPIPITPQDTQKNCAPVSSNCVIWQGPDIPFLNLCKGDSISDVTAKLAVEVSTLVTNLDIANFDISCFPPICPKPENINDLIQFILDKLCEGNTGSGSSSSFNCADSIACTMPIIACFQYSDTFGNLVTEMSVQDYATAIATRVCSIANQITSINNTLTDHDNRLEVLEACVLPCTPPAIPTVATSCLNPSLTDLPVTTFASNTETALCALQSGTGSPSDITTSLSKICIADNTAPLATPVPFMNNIEGWTPIASVDNLAESLSNLWIAFCDLRAAHQELAITVASCCGLTCNDVIFSLTGVKDTAKFIVLTPTGNVPNGFTYCNGATGATITVTDAFGTTDTLPTTPDVITAVNNNTPISINVGDDLDISGVSVAYIVNVSFCLNANDGALTCNNTDSITVINDYICTDINPDLIATGTSGELEVSFTSWGNNTTYQATLYKQSTGVIEGSHQWVNPTSGLQTFIFDGLVDGDYYYAIISVQQGVYVKNCTTVSQRPTVAIP